MWKSTGELIYYSDPKGNYLISKLILIIDIRVKLVIVMQNVALNIQNNDLSTSPQEYFTTIQFVNISTSQNSKTLKKIMANLSLSSTFSSERSKSCSISTSLRATW